MPGSGGVRSVGDMQISTTDLGLAARVQAGTAGWNGMDALAGYGDYTGDGTAEHRQTPV